MLWNVYQPTLWDLTHHTPAAPSLVMTMKTVSGHFPVRPRDQKRLSSQLGTTGLRKVFSFVFIPLSYHNFKNNNSWKNLRAEAKTAENKPVDENLFGPAHL